MSFLTIREAKQTQAEHKIQTPATKREQHSKTKVRKILDTTPMPNERQNLHSVPISENLANGHRRR